MQYQRKYFLQPEANFLSACKHEWLCSQAFSQGARIWVQDKCHCLAVLSFNTIKSWQTAYCSLHRKHSLWPWWILTSYKQSQATLLMKHISWTVIAWPQPSMEIFPSTQRVNAKILCFSSPWMCSNDKTRHKWKVFFGSDLSLILFNCSRRKYTSDEFLM